jgi:hypothetical protein
MASPITCLPGSTKGNVSACRRIGVPVAREPMNHGPQAGIPHSATPEFLSSRLLEETICQAAWGMAVSASFGLDIEHGVRDYSFWR